MSSWTTLAILVAPLAYRHAIPLLQSFRHKRTSTNPKDARDAPPAWFRHLRLGLLTFTVALHLLQATVYRPQSLFQLLDLPFGAPSSTIWDRLILREGYNPDFVPPMQAQLLLRLKTFEGRAQYMHFGDAIALCEVCHLDDTELLLSLLPALVGQYAIMAALFGWLTLGQGREMWRIYLCIILVAGFGTEVYANMQSWDTEIFLPEKLEVARHVAFAVLSLVAFILPAPAPQTSISSFVNPTLDRLSSQVDELQGDLSTVGIQRTTIMRDPALRAKLQHFWSIAERESEAAGEDAELQRVVRELQLQEASVKSEDGTLMNGEDVAQEGQERLEARAYAEATVERLLQSMQPSSASSP